METVLLRGQHASPHPGRTGCVTGALRLRLCPALPDPGSQTTLAAARTEWSVCVTKSTLKMETVIKITGSQCPPKSDLTVLARIRLHYTLSQGI